ncbi:follicle cell protein 3C-1 isoform X2 [Periplaneta americana]|uniref:follicle cell protein 3C-1 isoform X2 n=1 Tax=Periplaneta americana TaxID=6978 RepID=UPI0037E7EA83
MVVYYKIILADIQMNPLAITPPAFSLLNGNVLPTVAGPFPCVCGVFLSGQFVKGSHDPPTGNAALLHEHTDSLPCNAYGNKQCTNKCLDSIVKHLPNSPALICGSIERDCHKERAYLFIKNCNDTWINTNLSAGREYCCKDNIPYKCPILP